MNANDSERLGAILDAVGMERTDDEASANLIIFNTCSVREHAEERVYGNMKRFTERRAAGDDLLVGLTGCMAGRDKKGELKRRLPEVDFVFPTPRMVDLPRLIAQARPDWAMGGEAPEDYLNVHPTRHSVGQAFITIQTGCNHFCSYCVVPYARGLERNRPVRDILQEIVKHTENGVVDVVLLGQAVNAYIAPDPGSFSADNPYQNHFAALLWEVNQLPGIERIHWTAAHPLKMSDQVIHALTLPKQVNYLHLPAQSGSDTVLRRMNRKYLRTQFLDIINKVKEQKLGIALGTDLIVGFPGETEQDFEDTLDLYRRCDFDISYPAQYSPRPGTLSVRLFPDDVSVDEKKRRWQAVQSLMEETALRKNLAYAGKIVRVFVEKVSGETLFGTNDELKSVSATGAKPEMAGTFVRVKIIQPMTWLLQGEAI